MSKGRVSAAAVVVFMMLVAGIPSWVSSQPTKPRLKVFISDLHFGLGKLNNKEWNPREDFRWSRALASFLNAISAEGGDRVDLVIAGDFLELWQFPSEFPLCSENNPDIGCTVKQMKELAQSVALAHADALKLLGSFANRGDNRIYVIPGNHDAALLDDSVWDVVVPRMNSKAGRVIRETRGLWSSSDGKIVAEHGHQIWPDVNLYPDWPTVTSNGRMVRPWGEYFVQRLYNLEEDSFPKIDNLVPSSAGVKYRMKERGIFKSGLDLWKFSAFALFETSIRQKVSSLGSEKESAATEWDLDYARNKLGVDLILGAFASDDPFKERLIASKETPEQDEAEALGQILKDKKEVPDEMVAMLCDQLSLRTAQERGGNGPLCREPSLGYALSNVGVISRERALRKHLRVRRKDYPKMSVFVYGHTHERKMPNDFLVDQLHQVKIVNSGSFQRLVDDEKFRKSAAAKGQTPEQALQSRSLDDLSSCHNAVVVSDARRGRYNVELRNWYESPNGEGRFVSPCDSACSDVSNDCSKN